LSFYHNDEAEQEERGITDFQSEVASSRAILRRISSSTRVRGCQRYSTNSTSSEQKIVIKDNKVVQSSFPNLSVCKRATCPNCGQFRAAQIENEISAVIKETKKLGGKAQFIVATSRNAAAQDHEDLIRVQSNAYSKFLEALTPSLRARLSIAGVVHMPEISYTEKGINPHSNVIILYSAEVPDMVTKQVENIFARIWIDKHIDEGMPRPTRKNGIVSQEVYNAEAVSGYLTKSYKHGALKSIYNAGWFEENGMKPALDGATKNPYDILRMINADAKIRRCFVPIKKGQEIIRLGKLNFGVLDKSDGSITELKTLPLLVRHWLDYETSMKGRHIMSITPVAKNPMGQNEIFWQQVRENVNAVQETDLDDRKVITISYDIQDWIKTGGSVDRLISELNNAALRINTDPIDLEHSIESRIEKVISSWEISKAVA